MRLDLSLTAPRLVQKASFVKVKGIMGGGAPGTPVLIEQRFGIGKWKTVRIVTTDAAGTFRVRVRVGKAGNHRVRARFLGDGQHQASQKVILMRAA